MNMLNFRRNPDPYDEAIAGERGVTSVNKGMNLQARLTNVLVIGGVVVLGGFLLARYYAGIRAQQEAQAAPKPATHAANTPLPQLVTPAYPDAAPAAPAAANLPPLKDAPAGAAGQGAAKPMPTLQERRLGSPLSFKAGGMATAELPAQAAQLAPAALAGTPGAGVARALAPAPFAGSARAYLLPDPALMITRGAVIPCTVLPALDTTLPGIVTCIQGRDVRSADGKVVLLERGTKWVGQQAGGMAQGQNRIGITWARGETPNHVLVDVDSGGADALGRPGIGGSIDHHFWDRFGAAIMLSLISDVGPYLTATKQGGGNNNTTIAFPTVTSGAQSVMSDVLKTTLAIPPTLTGPQGAEIVIYVARDLDFRDVYALEAK